MKQITFHHAAHAELLEAIQHYKGISPGLAALFVENVNADLQLIYDNPEAFQRVDLDLRQLPLGKFPYSLFYALEHNIIRVVAVAHHKRKPGFWKNRP
jgi:toxin ParE1/3/4